MNVSRGGGTGSGRQHPIPTSTNAEVLLPNYQSRKYIAFIPTLRRRQSIVAASETTPASQPSLGYIDTPFDYGAMLAASPESLGKLPAAGNPTIAIIGAGISGLVSAYELLRVVSR